MHSTVSGGRGDDETGTGDRGLAVSWTRSSRGSTATVNDAPQISQWDSEGWFWKVHRGQPRLSTPGLAEAGRGFGEGTGEGAGDGRLAMAAMAALTTCTAGGLMPHARQGGIGVREARAGSKLDGTGFEKEQMGHTQVALAGGGAGAGLAWRGGVDEAGRWAGAETPRVRCRAGLGNRVILADEVRKPAWRGSAGADAQRVGTEMWGGVHGTRASRRRGARGRPSGCAGHRGRRSIRGARSGTPGRSGTARAWPCCGQARGLAVGGRRGRPGKWVGTLGRGPPHPGRTAASPPAAAMGAGRW